LETFDLTVHVPHIRPRKFVSAVAARILSLDANRLTLRWKVEGAGALVVPPFAGRARTVWPVADDLLLELFVKAPGGAAMPCPTSHPPSAGRPLASGRLTARQWRAAAWWSALRHAPRAAAVLVLIFDAAIPASALPPLPWAYGLTAVIEEEGGHKLRTGPSRILHKPDFHDPARFAATLAAPQPA
jgi:hypothetical protein